MKRVQLFAYPAWHSLSPAMHNAAFERLHIDARYEAREVAPEGLEDAVNELRSQEFFGANVTIPHKESVVRYLDTLSPEAQAVGAVNTIIRRGEELHGHTTDVSGFLRGLVELGVNVGGSRALLLGAGGAARAVAYALLVSGAGEVLVHNRTAQRGRKLARDLERFGAIRALDESELLREAPRAQLVVNATSVGMMREGISFEESPLVGEALPERGAVVDLIYRPAVTRLLREAGEKGLRTQNGLPMLVFQGAESFALWTGQDAPADVMREAAERVLAK